MGGVFITAWTCHLTGSNESQTFHVVFHRTSRRDSALGCVSRPRFRPKGVPRRSQAEVPPPERGAAPYVQREVPPLQHMQREGKGGGSAIAGGVKRSFLGHCTPTEREVRTTP